MTTFCHGLCEKCYAGIADNPMLPILYPRGLKDDGDERVFVLGKGMNRFVPQWDAELLGPSVVQSIQKDYNMPPKSDQLLSSSVSACKQCELIWLVGHEGSDAAASHPSHHTLYNECAGTRRSLVVHTDGACINNGQVNARSGVGVCFGPKSRYNFSYPLTDDPVQTNQRAELFAIWVALSIVRLHIIPARSEYVDENVDKKSFRLIITTDSSYAVECMCKHWQNWEEGKDPVRVLKNKKGGKVANSDVFLGIKDAVEVLAVMGVQVVYYHVRREFNKEADALAKASVMVKPE